MVDEPKTKPEQVEQPWPTNADDEAALDRAWARIAAEDAEKEKAEQK